MGVITIVVRLVNIDRAVAKAITFQDTWKKGSVSLKSMTDPNTREIIPPTVNNP